MAKDFNKDNTDFCIALYIMYAACVLCQFFAITLIPGVALLLTAYGANEFKIRRANIKGTIFESHLRWMIRTLGIGTCVYLPIAAIIATGFILKYTDILSLVGTIINMTNTEMMNSIYASMDKEIGKVTIICLIAVTPVVAWMFRRYWVGYKLIKEGKPIEKVKSWL